MALGALLGETRLRVYADGRIEGVATLAPETLAPPKRTPEARDWVVAGGRYAPVSHVEIPLPIAGSLSVVAA